MRQLRDDTHLILHGEVRVYRRERRKLWHKNADRKASTRYQHQSFITHQHTLTRVRARGIAFGGPISCKTGALPSADKAGGDKGCAGPQERQQASF